MRTSLLPACGIAFLLAILLCLSRSIAEELATEKKPNESNDESSLRPQTQAVLSIGILGPAQSFEYRTAARATWLGSLVATAAPSNGRRSQILYRFVVPVVGGGSSTWSSSTSLQLENSTYGDIITLPCDNMAELPLKWMQASVKQFPAFFHAAISMNSYVSLDKLLQRLVALPRDNVLLARLQHTTACYFSTCNATQALGAEVAKPCSCMRVYKGWDTEAPSGPEPGTAPSIEHQPDTLLPLEIEGHTKRAQAFAGARQHEKICQHNKGVFNRPFWAPLSPAVIVSANVVITLQAAEVQTQLCQFVRYGPGSTANVDSAKVTSSSSIATATSSSTSSIIDTIGWGSSSTSTSGSSSTDTPDSSSTSTLDGSSTSTLGSSTSTLGSSNDASGGSSTMTLPSAGASSVLASSLRQQALFHLPLMAGMADLAYLLHSLSNHVSMLSSKDFMTLGRDMESIEDVYLLENAVLVQRLNNSTTMRLLHKLLGPEREASQQIPHVGEKGLVPVQERESTRGGEKGVSFQGSSRQASRGDDNETSHSRGKGTTHVGERKHVTGESGASGGSISITVQLQTGVGSRERDARDSTAAVHHDGGWFVGVGSHPEDRPPPKRRLGMTILVGLAVFHVVVVVALWVYVHRTMMTASKKYDQRHVNMMYTALWGTGAAGQAPAQPKKGLLGKY